MHATLHKKTKVSERRWKRNTSECMHDAQEPVLNLLMHHIIPYAAPACVGELTNLITTAVKPCLFQVTAARLLPTVLCRAVSETDEPHRQESDLNPASRSTSAPTLLGSYMLLLSIHPSCQGWDCMHIMVRVDKNVTMRLECSA